MNRTSIPSQPETMRMPSRVLIEGELADITDSSETIDSDNVLSRIRDENSTVQPQDAVFQMPPLQQPETSYVESQDAIFQMPELVPETTSMSSPVSVETSLADINDSSGRIDFNDISLPSSPAWVQSQDANFPSVRRTLTQEERDSFTDSSGVINIDAIRVWQGLEPFREPPPVDPIFFTIPRQMTQEERNSFVNSSGAFDFDAMVLFLRNNPDRLTPRDDVLPPRQPETTSHEAYRSKGLSVRTISKYLKTMSAGEIRAHDIDGDRKICAVCLDYMCGQNDKVAILDECGHEFHYCCLKMWLRRKNICPLCRRTAIYNLQDR